MKIKKRIEKAALSVVFSLLVVSLFYNRYQLLVNEGKAKSIEELQKMVVNEIVDKYDTLFVKDSIILELQDSILILKEYEP